MVLKLMITKEEIIRQINECEVLKVKLLGKLELLDEMSRESKVPVETSEASGL